MAFIDGPTQTATDIQNTDNLNVDNSSAFKGFSGFNGFGGFSGFGKQDLSSPDALLELAKMQGGSLSQVAQELTNPTTSILSTISDGFKNAFSKFVDVISTPSYVVAGLLSPDKTVGEAINEKLRPSDVFWGQGNEENASTMQKVGNFIVRTATDILFDPLTYVTFGSSQGILGLRGATEISLGEKAATQVGKEALQSSALSPEASQIYKTLTLASKQADGTLMADLINKGGNIGELASDMKDLIKTALPTDLAPDFAKKAISNMLEKYPHLAETWLDKGGIKLFGKSILSGQAISNSIKLIPGMTTIDHLTAPTRAWMSSLFNPAYDAVHGKLPEEFLQLESRAKNLSESLGVNRLKDLSNIVRANGLNINDANMLMDAIEAGKVPAEENLARAYWQIKGFNEQELQFLQRSGIQVNKLDNYAPHILQETDVRKVPFTTPPKQIAEASLERGLAKFINTQTGEESIGTAEKLGLSRASTENLSEDAKAVQDFFTNKEGAIFKKASASVAELKQAGFNGFDDNVVTALATRTLQNTRVGIARQYMRELAQSFGAAASEAPDGWRRIDVKALNDIGSQILGKEGEEMLFHPAIAKRVENFVGSVINDEATNKLLENFDKVQRMWKASVTSIFPAFHGRNAISNVFLNYMDMGLHAINPTYHSASTAMLLNERTANKLEFDLAKGVEGAADKLSELNNKTMFTDRAGYDWTFGELRRIIKNNDIALSPNITGAQDLADSSKSVLNRLFPETEKRGIFNTATDVLGKVSDTGRAMGTYIENQARMVNFIANLVNTGDVQMAAKRTKQFLFDYSNLSPFEKTFVRRVIPFYTFTRKNLELQASTLLSAPGRISQQITALGHIGDLFSGGQKLSQKEQDALPDWIKSGIGILAKKEGSNVSIIGSLGTPVEQPFQALQPNQILGSISPLLRVPAEQMTGYSFFNQKPLSDVSNAGAFNHAPQFIKDLIGYRQISGKAKDGTPFNFSVALRPEVMNLILNLPPTSRILSSIKQIDTADVDTQHKIMQQLIGTKVYSFNLDVEAKRREAEMTKKLQDLLTKAGVTAQYTNVYIPKKR